jgi:hypothetical protein
MRTLGLLGTNALAAAVALALGCFGCDDGTKTPALSHTQPVVRNAPVPPKNGPQLGAVAELLHVREATDTRAASSGLLHAGARVARSAEPVSRAGCEGGWYAIRPRGFVCVGSDATLDLAHPTLAAMALAPKLDAELPYTYARARLETPLFERDPTRADAVREVGKLKRRAGMAVVGSWKAKDPSGVEERLALLTSGRFVKAADLDAANPSDFAGVELNQERQLPIAFVVKRGVRAFRLHGSDAEKGDLLEYHSNLPLSGRFRSLGKVKYWACEGQKDERWLRHQDVTVIQKRSVFPDFVKEDTRWLDVSVVTGTLVAYEGKRPTFVTLLSVARELPAGSGDTVPASDGPRPIPLGTFGIKQKALTFLGKDRSAFGEGFEVLDVPWALELSSGQLLHGAYWHDRFGMPKSHGCINMSPEDARRIFNWTKPEVPVGWHGALLPLRGTVVWIHN